MSYNERNWSSGANCAGAGFEGFYPPETGRDLSRARIDRVCAACPVRLFCMSEGLGDRWGVWGGAGPRERGRLTHGLDPRELSSLKEAVTQYALSGEDGDRLADIIEETGAPVKPLLRVLRFRPGIRRAAV